MTNIERFEGIMSCVKRDGVDKLMAYIKKSDFYTAPASTRFHGSCEGGLLQHSLNVYDCLIAKKENPIWKDKLANVSDETFAIVSLLHDLCKTYYYGSELKNQKTYDEEKVKSANPRTVKHDANGDFIWETVPAYVVDNKYPLGHGDKSVMFILLNGMNLTMEENMAIRWHMGAYEGQGIWNDLGSAFDKYPLALAVHEADMEATHLLEVE